MAASSSGQASRASLGGGLIPQWDQGRIILMTGTLITIIFGLLPNGVPGFIIVKEGEDAEAVFD